MRDTKQPDEEGNFIEIQDQDKIELKFRSPERKPLKEFRKHLFENIDKLKDFSDSDAERYDKLKRIILKLKKGQEKFKEIFSKINKEYMRRHLEKKRYLEELKKSLKQQGESKERMEEILKEEGEEFYKNYAIDLQRTHRKEVSGFFKDNPTIKEIVGYENNTDLIKLSNSISYYFDLCAKEIFEYKKSFKRDLKKGKKFLISLFQNADLKLNIYPIKVKDKISYMILITFNPGDVYINLMDKLVSIRKKNSGHINSEGFFIWDIPKDDFDDYLSVFAEVNQNYFLIKGLEPDPFLKSLNGEETVKIGVKIHFKQVFKNLWDTFKKEEAEEDSIQKSRKKFEKQHTIKEYLSFLGNGIVKNWKPITLIISVTFIACAFTIINYLQQPIEEQIVIEEGDIVRINYQVWIANCSDANEDITQRIPELNYADHSWKIEPITKDKDPDTGIILGVYNKLLGKSVNYNSGYVCIKGCVDNDLDGIDDSTNEPALGYGHKEHHSLYNKTIVVHFEVLSVTKT